MKYSKQLIESFYIELFELYKKYNICIHHENYQGEFILTTYPSSTTNIAKEYDIDWLYNAQTSDLIKNKSNQFYTKKFKWKTKLKRNIL